MACLVITSLPFSSLSSGPKSLAVLAANPSLRRYSLLRVRCGTNKRLVFASAIFQPTYFSSVSFPFPLRIFNQPSSSSGSAVVIAFLLSSVFAALAFVLNSRRKRRISERKIVPYDGIGVQLGPDHAAVSDEYLMGVSGARIIFSNEGMQDEEITQVCDSIGRPRQDSVISLSIKYSNAFGRGLEPRGLGFRKSSMLSSPFRETSGSEFGETGNCIVYRDAASGGISNAMAVHGQVLDEDEISDKDALQRAMPAIAMGAGILGMLTTRVHEGLEMVGFVAATSFIAYDLLWASNRKKWWNDITKVANREELMVFLRSRNIVNDV